MSQGLDGQRADETPTISVIVCAFTRERLGILAEAISALRSQTRPPREVLVVVDHSPELLAEVGHRWPDVVAVANEGGPGLCGARNSGLAASRGDVVAFLDDDAIPSPTWLERMAAGYSDPAVLAVGGPVVPRWTSGRPGWFPSEFDWVVGCTHSAMPQSPSQVRNLVGANMSFRREVPTAVGGFHQALSRVGDNRVGGDETYVCIRASERWPDGKLFYDPEVSVEHVVSPSRSRPGYFLGRCVVEGRSKALLAGLVGTEAGLASERTYTRRTLPRGFVRDLRDGLRGDSHGFARAAMIVLGLASTIAGYLAQRARPGGRARAPRGDLPLRVLMVTPRTLWRQGGVERNVIEVSRRLAAAGTEIEVLCSDPGGPALIEQRHDGVLIRTVRAYPANRDYYLAPGIWREMGRRRWDVIHIQSYHTLVPPLAMIRALTLGIPYVLTFHGGGHSQHLRNRMRGVQRRLQRPLFARAARLIAIARFEIDQYGRELRLPPEKFVLIPNGADLPAGGQFDRHAKGETGLLASIGRLERYKGHHRVIAALPHVLERQPDAHLLVVGSGPYEPELRRQAAELGIEDRVEITSVPMGDTEAMAALLQRVSLVVLMSEFETQPMVALEAAAAGRRLLVSDCGGLAELAEDGLARALALESNPEDVGRAIVEELSRRDNGQPPTLPTWDDCARRLGDLYESIA